MQPTERREFDAQMQLLCAGFNVPWTPERSEAFWTGLQRMHLLAFTRVVERALGEEGPERFPSIAQVWSTHRDLRRRVTAPPTLPRDVPLADQYTAFGNRCLLCFLAERGGVDEVTLQRLIAAKNRIAGEFRAIAEEDEVTADELREAMLGQFRREAA